MHHRDGLLRRSASGPFSLAAGAAGRGAPSPGPDPMGSDAHFFVTELETDHGPPEPGPHVRGGGVNRSTSRLSLWPSPAGGRAGATARPPESGRSSVGGSTDRPVGYGRTVGRARVGTEAVRRRERPWAGAELPEPVHLCIDATKNT